MKVHRSLSLALTLAIAMCAGILPAHAAGDAPSDVVAPTEGAVPGANSPTWVLQNDPKLYHYSVVLSDERLDIFPANYRLCTLNGVVDAPKTLVDTSLTDLSVPLLNTTFDGGLSADGGFDGIWHSCETRGTNGKSFWFPVQATARFTADKAGLLVGLAPVHTDQGDIPVRQLTFWSTGTTSEVLK